MNHMNLYTYGKYGVVHRINLSFLVDETAQYFIFFYIILHLLNFLHSSLIKVLIKQILICASNRPATGIMKTLWIQQLSTLNTAPALQALNSIERDTEN